MEFLIFGGLWFWGIFGFISFLILMNLIFSGREETIWIFGFLLVLLFFFSGLLNFSWIAENPLLVLRNVGIYIGIGLVWSMKEWYSFVKEQIKFRLQDMDKTFSKEQKKAYISRSAPYVSNNWTRIASWITYWPYHILSWALTDPIKKIAKRFRVVYSGITQLQINNAINKINKGDN